MRGALQLVVSGVGLAWLCVAVGCAPSLRRTQRGSVYFERCYAADVDPQVPDPERRTCWQAWEAHYTAGASAEHLDYARERLVMLDPERAAAIALATGDDGAPEAVDGVPEPPAPIDAPDAPTATTPTTDAARHEAIVEAVEADRAHERRLHRGVLPPRTTTPHCAASCQPTWEACTASCTASDRACTVACRRELALCARGCY